jgi:hypothetical protein
MIDYLCMLFVGDGICLDVPYSDTEDWKLMWEEARKVNNTKTYITNVETFR